MKSFFFIFVDSVNILQEYRNKCSLYFQIEFASMLDCEMNSNGFLKFLLKVSKAIFNKLEDKIMKCTLISFKVMYLFYISNFENYKMQKKDTAIEVQYKKIANVAGSVWLSLFMDGIGKCKLLSTSPSTSLSRIQHLNMVIVNFEISNIRRCVHTFFIISNNLQCDTSASPWQPLRHSFINF